jgi:hypothetical protein
MDSHPISASPIPYAAFVFVAGQPGKTFQIHRFFSLDQEA